jgi:putative sigma-54 modulation protein
MKLTYTGRQEQFPPVQQKKLDAKFAKLAKLMDLKGGEREAHVILTAERHLRRAEITVNVMEHPMVGVASETDQFTAVLEAAEHLEKQVLKLRNKKRDTKREARQEWKEQEAPAEAFPVPEPAVSKKIFKVDDHASHKPMTVEEALIELDRSRDYFVFRDAKTDRLSVLLRRRDGHFDLVEG